VSQEKTHLHVRVHGGGADGERSSGREWRFGENSQIPDFEAKVGNKLNGFGFGA